MQVWKRQGKRASHFRSVKRNVSSLLGISILVSFAPVLRRGAALDAGGGVR